MSETLNLKVTDVNKHIAEPKKLSEKYSEAEKIKLAKASKDFEAIMTSFMLKSMTKNTEGLLGGGDNYGGEVFDTLFEQGMSEFISNSKGMGIANIIYKRMTGEELPQIVKIPRKATAINKTENNENNTPPAVSVKKKDAVPVMPGKSALKRLEQYNDIISEASAKYGVSENIIKSVILTESAAKENAISKAKAKGLMQLMDFTAKDMGVKNVWDPRENIMGGTKYLSQLIEKYNGNLEFALAAYNAGPGNVNKYNGIPPFEETQNYVKRVKSYLSHFESDGEFA